MTNNPKVSIIIPCYNYALYLPETIGSILNQTYKNWECIIVDDGSTDNSKEVAESLCAKDNRIAYYLQKNSGPTVARNWGLKLSTGQFIQFLDADDLIENQKLEKQLLLFENDAELDVVYSNVKYFKSGNIEKQYNNMTLEGSDPWMKKLSGKGEPMISAFLNENLMVIHSPLFRKTLVEKWGGMDEDLYFNEDWELWTRYAIGNAKFQFDDSKGTNALVRVHDSYSKDNFKMFVYGLLACLKLNTLLNDNKYRKIMIPKIAYHKRIIDEKLILQLSTDKVAAIEKALFVEKLTGISRYKLYSRLFKTCPVWFSYLYSKFLFIIHKLKNVIVYA